MSKKTTKKESKLLFGTGANSGIQTRKAGETVSVNGVNVAGKAKATRALDKPIQRTSNNIVIKKAGVDADEERRRKRAEEQAARQAALDAEKKQKREILNSLVSQERFKTGGRVIMPTRTSGAQETKTTQPRSETVTGNQQKEKGNSWLTEMLNRGKERQAQKTVETADRLATAVYGSPRRAAEVKEQTAETKKTGNTGAREMLDYLSRYNRSGRNPYDPNEYRTPGRNQNEGVLRYGQDSFAARSAEKQLVDPDSRLNQVYRWKADRPKKTGDIQQDVMNHTNWQNRGRELRMYDQDRDADLSLKSDDWLQSERKKLQETIDQKRATMPQMETERQGIRERQNDLGERAGDLTALSVNGLQDWRNNRYLSGRPDEYFEEDAAQNGTQNYYDGLIWDAVHGVYDRDGNVRPGARRYEDILRDGTDEEADAAIEEVERLWEELESGRLQERLAQEEERLRQEQAAAQEPLNVDTRSEEKELAKIDREIQNRQNLAGLTAGASGSGAYNEGNLPASPQTRMTTEGDMYYYVSGDKTDQAYFDINNSWRDQQGRLIGDILGEDAANQATASGFHWSDAKEEWFLTDEEKQIFNQFYNSGDKGRAQAFLDGLHSSLNSRKTQYQEDYQRRTASGPLGWIEGAGTVLTNGITGMVGTVATIAGALGNREAQDENSDWWALQRYSDAVRDERGNQWDESLVNTFGQGARGVGKFLYGVTTSMADNIAAMATANGIGAAAGFGMASRAAEGIVQFLMSSQATSSAMLQNLRDNRDPLEAALMAVGSGLIEGITENIGYDALFKADPRDLMGNTRQLLRYLGNVSMAEGMEEVTSDLMNTAMDEIVSMARGHESEIRRDIDALVAQGMSETAAAEQVLVDYLKQLGMSGAAGALSGLLLSGGRTAMGKTGTVFDTRRDARAAVEGNTLGPVLEAAGQIDGGPEYNTQIFGLQKQFNRNGNLSTREAVTLFKLMRQTSIPMVEDVAKNEAANVVKEQINSKLEKEGIRADGAAVTAAAQGATELLTGDGELTREQRAAIQQVPQALEVVQEISTQGTEARRTAQSRIREAQQPAVRALNSISEAANPQNNVQPMVVDAESVGEQMATEEDIRTAEGERTGGSREVILDGKYGKLTGLVQTEDGLKYRVDVGGETKTADASEIRATDFATASVMRQQTADPGLFGQGYTNQVLQEIESGNIKNAGDLLTAATQIRYAAFTGQSLPRTSLPAQTAQRLYDFTRAERNNIRMKETSAGQRNALKPGNGRATFKGAEYGTEAFDKAIANLSKTEQNRITANAEVAKRFGIELTFVDNEQVAAENEEFRNLPGSFYGSESKSGIQLNIEGEEYGRDENGQRTVTGRHHIGVAFGHEATHWLQRNSLEGYDRLERFVFDTLRREHGTQYVNTRISEVMQRRGLDIAGAMSEIVADSCDQILGSETVMQHIQETDSTLFGQIKSFVKNLVERMKAAARGMSDSASRDAVMMFRHTNELARIWLGAYDEALSGMTAQNTTEENKTKERYSRAGIDPETGRTVYISNFREGTPNAVKANRIISLVQNIWSKKPVTLIIEENGREKQIEANYDPDFDTTGERKTDLGKLAFGNRLGSSAERRVMMNLADDYRDILENAGYYSSEKERKGRQDIKNWHYFINDVYYAEQGSDETTPYRIEIDVKEKNDGSFVYTYFARELKSENKKKLSVMGLRPVNVGVMSGESASASDKRISQTSEKDNIRNSVANIAPEETAKQQYELTQRLEDAAGKVRELRAQYKELTSSDEFNRLQNAFMEATSREESKAALKTIKAWEEENGIAALNEQINEAEQNQKAAQKEYSDFIEQRDLREEQEKIEKSGLSEPDWRRKEAVKQFGYTTDFREAGYLLPNGKMLNFSGEKGRHTGSRGQDHRNISILYATKQGSAAMNAFMADGNIRVMAETPGVDITVEPTKEQYAQLRGMARRFAGEEYFSVDFSDKNGNNIDSIEYDGRVNPERVINDIKTFFATGSAPQQSIVSQFHDIRYSSAEMNRQYEEAYSNGDRELGAQLVAEAARKAGYTIRAYHGTSRADRVGNVFRPDRATSGPMAFFTDNREIAENYARDKKDTSIAYDEEYGDYFSQFRAKNKRGKSVPVGDLWNEMSYRDRQRVLEAGKHIAWDEDVENIIYDPNADVGNGGFQDWSLREHKGNAINTLIEAWLNSGDLYNQEGRFLDVLRLAGIEGVEWNNPDAREEKVYDTFLRIQQPFNTGEMYNEDFLQRLESWWEEQDPEKYEKLTAHADPWDKNNRSLEDWIEAARRDLRDGSTRAWTSIPDAVTDFLKSEGYDGIQDTGGKNGGMEHTVWIPFSSEQVKSAEPFAKDDGGNLIPLSKRFNKKKVDIRYSSADEFSADVNAWMSNISVSSLQTEDERQLWQAWKGKRLEIQLSLKRQMDYQAKLKRLQNAESLTAAERDEMTALENKVEIQKQKYDKLQEEMYQITSSEGYAGMMYQQNTVLQDFIYGRTQEQMREAVEQMMQEVEQARKEIDLRTAELDRLAKTEAVKSMRRLMKDTSLGMMASMLKSEYSSGMNETEIGSRLAEMALRQIRGEGITEDVEALAADLINKMRGVSRENLDIFRGRTFAIGESTLQELHAENSNMREIRSALKGSGVKIVVEPKSRLQEQWNEIREYDQSLPDIDGIAEIDKLHEVVDYIATLMRNNNGGEQFGVDRNEVAQMVQAAAASVVTYMTEDTEARQQIERLLTSKRDGKAGEIAASMDQIQERMKTVIEAGHRAKNWTDVLESDVQTALNYYNTTARVAAEEERNKVRKRLLEQLRSENMRKLNEQRDKYEKQMKEDRKARLLAQDNAALRSKVTTITKRLGRLLTMETDLKNIPEEAKPLARIMLRMIARNDFNGNRKVTTIEHSQLERLMQVLDAFDKRDGEFSPEDLDWLVTGEGEGADYEIRDKVAADLQNIESGIIEYVAAEGMKNITLMDRKNALTRIQTAATEIYEIIRARQMVEIDGKKMLAEEIALQVQDDMANSRFKGEFTGKIGKGIGAVRGGVIVGNMTPEYFFKNLRNKTLSQLYNEYHTAENRAGLEYGRAKQRIEQIAKDTGYSAWDLEKRHTLHLKKGGDVQLNLEQMMQLYATWKREAALQNSETDTEKTFHLGKGGFYVENDQKHKIAGREIFRQRSYRMMPDDFEALSGMLTDKQREYADRIVSYLSNEMSELGNEASMRMYGIKKYNEKYYFPFEIWSGVKAVKSDAGAGGSAESHRGAHPGFSNRLRNNASNALMIRGFTQMATKHIVGMINYNTFAPAIEFTQRVMNQQTATTEEDNITRRNLWAAFGEAYGKDALDYFQNFQRDINGGTTRPDRTFYDRLLSTFRKSAVAGSMSVALQQPLSYIRAGIMIDPKYLTEAFAKQWKGAAAEMEKWSGVAVIKAMGKFDMGIGASAQEFLTPDSKERIPRTVYNKAADIATMLPEAMDQLTWTRIWVACKLEQKAKHPDLKTDSEEFLTAVAERFNDVLRKTQVYDSTLVRSRNMRNTNPIIKSLTSFMAEPTLTANVLADAVANVREKGGAGKLARAAAAFLLSAIAQALVKGIMGAGRNPDEKKTWDENNAYRFMYNFINEVNPLSLIPGYGDMIALLKKGEVSDDASSVVGKIMTAVKTGNKLVTGQSENVYRDVEDSVGILAQLFSNIPAKNLARDARAIYNFFTQPYAQRENNAGILKYQTMDLIMTADNLLGAVNEMTGKSLYGTSNTAYYQRIYDAKKAGDETAVQQMTDYLTIGKGVEEKTINSNINTLTRKDEDVPAAERAKALMDNGYGSMTEFIKEQYKKGEITRKEAERLMAEADPKKAKKDIMEALDSVDWKNAGNDDKNYSNYTPLYDAISTGNTSAYSAAKKKLVGYGFKEDDIESKAKTFILQQYKEGKATKAQAESMLKKFRKDLDGNDIWWELDRADYAKQTGESVTGNYYRLYDAIEANKSDQIKTAVKQMVEHGYDNERIKKAITSKYKQQYLGLKAGSEKTKLMDALTKAYKAVGLSANEALKIINGWKTK